MKTFNRITLLTLTIMRMCLTVILVMASGVGRVLEFAFQGWMGLLELIAMWLEATIDWMEGFEGDDDDPEERQV